MKHTLTLGPFVFLCLLVLSVVVRGQSPQAKHPPYALPEVLEALNGGISPKQFVTLISEYGVDFRLNDESENKIRAAGGNDSLVIAIAKSFKEKIAATPRSPGGTKINPKDGLTYVWIPPGTFRMGCSTEDIECDDSEKPAHDVTISKGFWMGQTTVTQAGYKRVIGTKPSSFHGDSLPVESVTWDEARTYCTAVGMRLPTEAEWEYAARAGSTASRYGDIDAIAWYADNSGKQTHKVGQKQPNAWKLYDMLGNVWQWTGDWFNDYDAKSEAHDPTGPTSGQYRALRGGSFFFFSRFARVSRRGWNVPGERYIGVGFRCVGE